MPPNPNPNPEKLLGKVTMGGNISIFRIGYEELYTLCDLYIKTKQYPKIITTLKEGIRRLNGQFRNDINDAEFEEFDIPPEITVQMGIGRLLGGFFEIANVRFFIFIDIFC